MTTTVAKMRRITTNAGDAISIEADTDQATIAILKAAPVTSFSEFVYTGNSPNGSNNGNYDDLEAFFKGAGLTIKDDDLDYLIYNLERISGVTSLQHRGKTLRYHVQAHPPKSEGTLGQFGYRWRADYRLISVE